MLEISQGAESKKNYIKILRWQRDMKQWVNWHSEQPCILESSSE